MASVFLAEQEIFGRQVALKVLSPDLADNQQFGLRFTREVRLVANFNHPNIVTVFDSGCIDGMYYLAMEHLSGGDLRRKLSRGISILDAIGMIVAAADAIGYAATKGVVHRDIKPANIMLREDDSLAIVDFGIAFDVNSQTMVTEAGTVLGTAKYMSPEQTLGERIDHRADIYSLGIVLYEMLVGNVPFSADSVAGIALKQLNEPVPELPIDLAPFQPVIDGMLEKSPDDRYQDVTTLMADLRNLAHTLPVDLTSTILTQDEQNAEGRRSLSEHNSNEKYLRRRSSYHHLGTRPRKHRQSKLGRMAVLGASLAVGSGLLLAGWYRLGIPPRDDGATPAMAVSPVNNPQDSGLSSTTAAGADNSALDVTETKEAVAAAADEPQAPAAGPTEQTEAPPVQRFAEPLAQLQNRVKAGNLLSATQGSAYRDLHELRTLGLTDAQFEQALSSLNRAAGSQVDELLRLGRLDAAERHIDDWEMLAGSVTPRDFRIRLINQQRDRSETKNRLSYLTSRASELAARAPEAPAANRDLLALYAELLGLEPGAAQAGLDDAVAREVRQAQYALKEGNTAGAEMSLALLRRVVPNDERLADIAERIAELEEGREQVTAAISRAREALRESMDGGFFSANSIDRDKLRIQRLVTALSDLVNAEEIEPYGNLAGNTKTELLQTYQRFFNARLDSGNADSATLYITGLEQFAGLSMVERAMLTEMKDQLAELETPRRRDFPSF